MIRNLLWTAGWRTATQAECFVFANLFHKTFFVLALIWEKKNLKQIFKRYNKLAQVLNDAVPNKCITEISTSCLLKVFMEIVFEILSSILGYNKTHLSAQINWFGISHRYWQAGSNHAHIPQISLSFLIGQSWPMVGILCVKGFLFLFHWCPSRFSRHQWMVVGLLIKRCGDLGEQWHCVQPLGYPVADLNSMTAVALQFTSLQSINTINVVLASISNRISTAQLFCSVFCLLSVNPQRHQGVLCIPIGYVARGHWALSALHRTDIEWWLMWPLWHCWSHRATQLCSEHWASRFHLIRFVDINSLVEYPWHQLWKKL